MKHRRHGEDHGTPRHKPAAAPGYVPATFRDRGVIVPFTTPSLRGARARQDPLDRIEFLLPSPDRRSGLRVLPWEHVCTVGQPSIHDHRLNQHLQRLTQMTPASVRRAAQAVASEGLAGRAVLAAARAAMQADQRATEMLHNRLVTDPTAHAAGPGILAWIAEVFAPIGIAGQIPAARVPALLDRLERMRSDVLTWALAGQSDSRAGANDRALAIADGAERTLQLTTVTVQDAQAVLGSLPRLLRRLRTNSSLIGEIAVRPLWLLDGWEDIILLWEDAASPDRLPAALDEMARLMPAIPREIREWVTASAGRSETVFYRRSVPLNEDWRSGVTAMLLSRNERLRGQSS